MGQPNRESVLLARSLLSEMPAVIREAAREPYGARAVMYCLLLDKEAGLREQQRALLQERADKDVYALAISLMPQVDALELRFRLPIIDIAIPALKQLSDSQYPPFLKNLAALINMDAKVDLFEWSLLKILSRHLDGHFHKPLPTAARYQDAGQLTREFGFVLSVMAHAGAMDQDLAQRAFDASVPDLDQALGKLDQLAPAAKSRLLTACVISIWHDQRATPTEVELLRAFASVLDCPMPPGIVPGDRRAA
jgi:hypothetical protein